VAYRARLARHARQTAAKLVQSAAATITQAVRMRAAKEIRHALSVAKEHALSEAEYFLELRSPIGGARKIQSVWRGTRVRLAVILWLHARCDQALAIA
jgi:hypothetical protein